MSGVLPLHGLRVVEYARDLPARYAGFLLADLGAEVTALRDDDGDRHPVLDRGKRLVRAGDVSGRTAARGADAVLADRRRSFETPDDVVWCDVSGWGRRGPRRHDPYDADVPALLADDEHTRLAKIHRFFYLAHRLAEHLLLQPLALPVLSI